MNRPLDPLVTPPVLQPEALSERRKREQRRAFLIGLGDGAGLFLLALGIVAAAIGCAVLAVFSLHS